MSEHDRVVELLAIYSLGATTDPESQLVARHLGSCRGCREELATHLTTVAALGGDPPPPTEVWRRIERQIHDPRERSEVSDLSERRSRKSFAYAVSIAAATMLVVASAVISRSLQSDSLSDPLIVTAANAAAEQAGATVFDFEVDGSIIAHAVLAPDGHGFIIPTDDLEPLDDSRAYQLWVINTDDAVISAGVLGNAPGPSIFTWSGDVSGLALTREVAGGVVSSAGDVVSVVMGA